MKLKGVYPANDGKHKYKAVFINEDGREKTTLFGAEGYSDYNQHKDIERRQRYRFRHKKDLLTKDPTRAGFLSYYLLWGDTTDLDTNIRKYKKMFHLE